MKRLDFPPCWRILWHEEGWCDYQEAVMPKPIRKKAAETLVSREELLRAVGDNIPDGATYRLIMDRDGQTHFACVSAGFESLFELRESTVLRDAAALYRLLHPDDMTEAMNAQRRSAEALTPFRYECRFNLRSGLTRWVRWHSMPERLPDGVVAWDGVAIDITEKKRIEEALRKAKEQTESILNGITDLYIAYDRQLRFTDMNVRAEHDSGLRREDLIGKPLLAVLPHAKSTELYRQYRTALSTNGPVHADCVHSPLTGKCYETHVYPSKDGLAVYYKDITKRKEAEEALRKAKERTEGMLNGMTDTYVAFDRQFRFTEMNRLMEKQLGRRKEDLLGKVVWEVFPEMKKGPFYPLYMKAAATQTAIHAEPALSPVTGLWYEAHIYPSSDGLSVCCRDVTKRKTVEAALQKAHDEMEQKVKDRTAKLRELAVQLDQAEQQERRRVAQILHDDLQQVLVGTRLKLDAVKKTASDADQRKTVEQVEENLANACATMRSLCVELHPPVLFEGGIAAALKWLADDVKEKFGLAVKLVMDKIDESSVLMLRTFVFNAVRELLFNVVKHGGVNSAEVRVSAADADSVRIEVRDRGIGFDPMQVRAGGFGLFSIRERAEYLGGIVTIQSKPGKGSCITLTLPRI
jgi:PAS domain S-box-containing protein